MWFNADAFRVLPAFTPRTNPYQYDGITGPIMWNVDATVSSSFRFGSGISWSFGWRHIT